jgi:ADP-ribosylglycohydrolase
MRAAPLGLLFAGDPAALRAAVRDQSRITHLDPRCAAGAVAVAGTAFLATAPGPLDPREVLRRLTVWVEVEDTSVARAVAGVEGWLRLEPSAAAARLRAEGLDPGHISPWLGISAFVTPSVAWSLYAFLRTPDDYWTTVCTAIAVGGDTDTMGAIAGALAGARLGPGALPPDLLARLTDRGRWSASDLAQLAADCSPYTR